MLLPHTRLHYYSTDRDLVVLLLLLSSSSIAAVVFVSIPETIDSQSDYFVQSSCLVFASARLPTLEQRLVPVVLGAPPPLPRQRRCYSMRRGDRGCKRVRCKQCYNDNTTSVFIRTQSSWTTHPMFAVWPKWTCDCCAACAHDRLMRA